MADLNCAKIRSAARGHHFGSKLSGKLKAGFGDAHTSMVNTASERTEIPGEFGQALNSM